MDFSKIKGITIPEGIVTKIMRGAEVLWEKIVKKYTNLADPTSADWGTDKRLGSDGTFRDLQGCIVTNYIPMGQGDTVRVKGMDLTTYNISVYTWNKVVSSAGKLATHTLYFSDITATTTGGQATWISAMNNGYIRFSGVPNGKAEDIIITVNEEITSSDTKNLFDKDDTDVLIGYRMNSSNQLVYFAEEQLITGYIDGKYGDVFVLTSDKANNTNNYKGNILCYDSNKNYVGKFTWRNTLEDTVVSSEDYKTVTFNIKDYPGWTQSIDNTAFVRFGVAYTDIDSIVITKK